MVVVTARVRVRSRNRSFAIPVAKVEDRDYVGVPPIGSAAKLYAARRGLRA